MDEFYTHTLIPPAVARELDLGRALGVDLPDIGALPWVKIQAPEARDKVPTVADLGAGEKEVLALGLEVANAVVILDERLGRLRERGPFRIFLHLPLATSCCHQETF